MAVQEHQMREYLRPPRYVDLRVLTTRERCKAYVVWRQVEPKEVSPNRVQEQSHVYVELRGPQGGWRTGISLAPDEAMWLARNVQELAEKYRG